MRKTAIFFICFISLLSCETWDYYKIDDFNYGTDYHNIKIVINGGISSQFVKHKLYLIKPGSLIEKSDQTPIIDAHVCAIANSDTFQYELITYLWSEYDQQYIELETPFYQSINKFSAIPGEEYTIHIEYNNELFTASDIAPKAQDFNFAQIPLPNYNGNTGDSISIDLSIKKHHFGFPASSIYLWGLKRSIPDSVNFITNISAKSYAHQLADVQGVFAQVESYTHFTEGNGLMNDTIVTIMQTISDDYYEFIRQGFNETDWKESTFATISGNLPTNVSEGGAGFFYVSDLYKKDIIIKDLLKYDLNLKY